MLTLLGARVRVHVVCMWCANIYVPQLSIKRGGKQAMVLLWIEAKTAQCLAVRLEHCYALALIISCVLSKGEFWGKRGIEVTGDS